MVQSSGLVVDTGEQQWFGPIVLTMMVLVVVVGGDKVVDLRRVPGTWCHSMSNTGHN